MELFNSAGQLLKQYRQSKNLTMEVFARRLKKGKNSKRSFSLRQYGRWEKDEDPISTNGLTTISENTQIPYEVLFRLNNQYPTLYSLYTHRYSTCTFDNDYVNRKILNEQLSRNKSRGNIEHLYQKNAFNELISYDFPYYPNKGVFERPFVKKAIKRLPDINLIVKDPIGYYSGHMVCLPIPIEISDKLIAKQLEESKLSESHILDKWDESEPIGIHILSFHSTKSTYAYYLIRRMAETFKLQINSKFHFDSRLSKYSVTKDGNSLSRKLGLKYNFKNTESINFKNLEYDPQFWSQKISELDFWKKITD